MIRDIVAILIWAALCIFCIRMTILARRLEKPKTPKSTTEETQSPTDTKDV